MLNGHQGRQGVWTNKCPNTERHTKNKHQYNTNSFFIVF